MTMLLLLLGCGSSSRQSCEDACAALYQGACETEFNDYAGQHGPFADEALAECVAECGVANQADADEFASCVGESGLTDDQDAATCDDARVMCGETACPNGLEYAWTDPFSPWTCG